MSEIDDTPAVIAPPPLLALAALVLGLLLDWIAPAYVLYLLLSLAERIVIGVALITAGAALIVVGERNFHRAGTEVKPWRSSTALVSNGIYTYIRNPMYVGATLLLGGLGVALASDWTLVMTVAFVGVIHFWVIKREERYLEAKFGDTYRAYKARVPRYGWPF